MNLQVLLLGLGGICLWYWPMTHPAGLRRGAGSKPQAGSAGQPVRIGEFELFVRHVSALLSGGSGEVDLWRAVAASNRDSAVANLAEACAARAAAGLGTAPVFRNIAERAPQRDPVRTAAIEFAACLELAARNGVPMAEVLERLAGHLDSAAEVRGLQRIAMAGPSATAALLGWLPLLGLASGYLMGLDPLGVLMSSPLGWAALIAGGGLLLLGRFWMSALLRSAGTVR
ncbi:MAG: type II secretion system F family protein [Renibacterium sp.]|nr:type II secretion system F family protein [Renibacterium sp.]